MTKMSRLGLPGMLSVIAGVLGGLVVVAYLAIMAWEGDNSWGLVMAWALAMAVPGALAFASIRLPPQRARWTRVAAAVLFAALGFFTSLGLGLLPAAALSGLAAYRTKEPVPGTG